jgi:hypothetical protein
MQKEKERTDRLESARLKKAEELESQLSLNNVHYNSRSNLTIGSGSTLRQRPALSNNMNLTSQQEKGLINRLAYASPKRYKPQTLEASDKYRKY